MIAEILRALGVVLCSIGAGIFLMEFAYWLNKDIWEDKDAEE